MRPLRILLLQTGSFSHTNRSLQEALLREFPGAEMRVADLRRPIKQSLAKKIAFAAHGVAEYGVDLMVGKRDLDDAVFGSRFAFEAMKEQALRAHSEWPADVSLQTQSMYDLSGPRAAHFVYTDHTYVTCRSYPVYGQAKWAPLRPDWLIGLERRVYENAAAVFTMSGNVCRDLREFYGLAESRALCVNAGPNTDLAPLHACAIEAGRYQSGKILFVGVQAAWERKGGEHLLRAFRIVRSRLPDAALVIVGTMLRAHQPGVTAVGPVPREQVARYFAECSAFCMPSQLEPFGIVYIEAMHAGLPIVAYELGAAPDFVIPAQTGYLVRPGDSEALADALVDLLGDAQKCCTLGSNARMKAKAGYTWEYAAARMAERIRAELDGALGAGLGRRPEPGRKAA